MKKKKKDAIICVFLTQPLKVLNVILVSDINNKEKVKQVGGKINELIYSKPIP